jgi:hypothetical protein
VLDASDTRVFELAPIAPATTTDKSISPILTDLADCFSGYWAPRRNCIVLPSGGNRAFFGSNSADKGSGGPELLVAMARVTPR